jgi:hypothetical protein
MELITDQKMRSQLSKLSLQQAEKFSCQKQLWQLKKFYNDFCK